MVDYKITELTEDTAPTSDDMIVTVNSPGGSPTNKKVTLANVIAALKAPGASITTGADDTLIVTPKAMADAGVNTRLQSMVISATRDMTAASGNVSYTGTGFVPTAIICIASITGAFTFSMGIVDSSKTSGVTAQYGNNTLITEDFLVQLYIDSNNYQRAVVSTFDANGFTLTWVKQNSPTGTANLRFLCFK